MNRVIRNEISTVAVSAPVNGMPVPGADRMPGFTTTMYAIVKKVVTPPAKSPYLDAEGRLTAGIEPLLSRRLVQWGLVGRITQNGSGAAGSDLGKTVH